MVDPANSHVSIVRQCRLLRGSLRKSAENHVRRLEVFFLFL